ncbi:hypothetical protein D3C73_1665900 [compost metagenome]
MHDAKVSDFVIQRSMRHSNMDTTTVYLKIKPEGIRHAFDALPAVSIPERSGRKRVQQPEPIAA